MVDLALHAGSDKIQRKRKQRTDTLKRTKNADREANCKWWVRNES